MMRPAVMAIPEASTRPITPAEVRAWFARGRKPWPDDALCAEIADRLTKTIRWPSNDASPKLKRRTQRGRMTEAQAWAAQVKALLDDVPTMLERLDENSDGYAAIEAMREALLRALPSIEFPFGSPEEAEATLKQTILLWPELAEVRPVGPKEMRPAVWHMHAVLIARIISKALKQIGRHSSLHRNSVLVRVVSDALVRIGFTEISDNDEDDGAPLIDRVHGAVSMHLIRWCGKFHQTF